MILTSRHGGNTDYRIFEGENFIPAPGSPDAVWGGSLRNRELAVPAIAAAAMLVSETVASFVMRVYEGDAQERRPLLNAPQARLFQEPADGVTSFDLWSDLVSSVELGKHGFLWKVETRAGVEEIYPVDGDYFRVSRVPGTPRKKIEAWIEGERRDVTANVIHVRGWSPIAGAPEGVSKRELHGRTLRAIDAFEEYRGRYFENETLTGLVLTLPDKNPTREQKRDALAAWVRRNGGYRNTGRPGLIWGDMKVDRLGSNLQEAQAVELTDAVVRDVARMMRIFPISLLHAVLSGKGEAAMTAESTSELFLRFSLLGRMRRIERAIAADRAVFPDRRRYPRFDASEFVRADVATLAKIAHALVQVGLLTKNEGRAMCGLPPIAGGDVFLEIPVGAGGNLLGGDAPPPIDDEDDEDDRALVIPAEYLRALRRRQNGASAQTP